MKLFQIKKEIFPIMILLIVLVVGWFFYPQLPEKVPSHWDLSGEINGWSSRISIALLMPLMYLGIYLILSFVVLLDPFKKNIEKFYDIYFGIKLAIVIFLSGLHSLIIASALTTSRLPIDKLVIFGTGALLVFLGSIMTRLKRNFFIGIRFPWTLASDIVWEKTHKAGKFVFISTGVAVALSGFWGGQASFILMMVLIFGGIIGLAVYSYLEYKKLPLKKKPNL